MKRVTSISVTATLPISQKNGLVPRKQALKNAVVFVSLKPWTARRAVRSKVKRAASVVGILVENSEFPRIFIAKAMHQ